MHLGLIGGIGPAATDTYYRALVREMAQRGTALEMTIVHADAPTLIGNLMADAQATQVEIYLTLTRRLAAAGADCVAITSMGGHFCVGAFAQVSPLPVVDMVEVVARHVAAQGYTRLGVMGTGPVMASGLYGGLAEAEILPPIPEMFDAVHAAYVEMAGQGAASAAHRATFDACVREMMEGRGAQAIIMGGTDLSLVYAPDTADFPIVDCALLHVDALADLASA